MSDKTFYRIWFAAASLVLLTGLFCDAVSSEPDFGPQPPCGSETFPTYPDVDKAPTVRTWDESDLGRSWIPPACTHWTAPGFTTLVVVAARFSNPSGVEALLRRVGAISKLAGVRYWSTTHKRWQTLIVDAYALSGPAGDQHRKDFSPDEIAEGKLLYFQQKDNLAGMGIYRTRIQSISPDRLVFDTENISTMRYLLMPVFHPGDVQSIYFLERESPDVWRYYSITRTGKNASRLTTGHQESAINRAVAFFRYMIGIPTDQEPPAAR